MNLQFLHYVCSKHIVGSSIGSQLELDQTSHTTLRYLRHHVASIIRGRWSWQRKSSDIYMVPNILAFSSTAKVERMNCTPGLMQVAGVETKSQSGLVIVWAGSIISWRSSKQSVSALNTAEAELYAATLGWQVVEGVRKLLTNFGIDIPKARIYIDNQAALTIAKCGASWRTRYFATRGHRLQEEHLRGAAELVHCPTAKMIADCLTKLATVTVIQVTHDAMEGRMPEDLAPTNQAKHATSVTPGKSYRGDITGDGPLPSDLLAARAIFEEEGDIACIAHIDGQIAALAPCASTTPTPAPATLQEHVPRLDPDGSAGASVASGSARQERLQEKIEQKTEKQLPVEEAKTEQEPPTAKKKRRGKKRTRPGSSERRWKKLEEQTLESSLGHPEASKSSHDEGSM